MSTTNNNTSIHGNFGTPRVARILVPPSLTPLICTSTTPAATSSAAIQALATRTDASRMPTGFRKTFQKHVTLHPSQPLLAYVLQTEAITTSQHRVLCVQNSVTQQVIWNVAWVDVAAAVFNEPDPSKWISAAKALGEIISLEFYDPSTLYWSGMLHKSNTTGSPRWQGLMVQTTSRTLVLNLRRNSQSSQVWPSATTAAKTKHQSLVMAHLCEGTVGGIPSTNALALTSTFLLVGCTDGTLKCFDRTTQQTFKSIKGLGKGDWMVQLHAANPYAADSANTRRRMVTVTKKGAAYLIELEINDNSLEIKPPLARFVGGWAENPPDSIHENSLLRYDPHRNWILWLQPTQQHQAQPVLHVWNLNALRKDFLQVDPKSGGLKPDPTLQIQVVGSGVVLVEPAGLAGTAWGDSPCTILLAAVSPSGALFLQGSITTASEHRPQILQATPVVGVQLADLILRDAGFDHDLLPQADNEPSLLSTLRVHAVRSQVLGPTCFELAVATNIGILMIQIPLPPLCAARHLHFGAGLGSLGKSLLTMQASEMLYASLDTLSTNPVGFMEPKNPVPVYTSPPPIHLPGDLSRSRAFRAGSYTLLPSPSGLYVALVWHSEYKYEILHTATLLQKVAQARGMNKNSPPVTRSPCVASGTGVADFCWVGDQDVYALIHAPNWEQSVLELVPIDSGEVGGAVTVNNLTVALGAGVKNVTSATMAATKAATSATKAATSKTLSAATSKTISATKTVNKGIKKFGMFVRKKGKEEGGGMADSGDDDASEAVSTVSITSQLTNQTIMMPAQVVKERKRYVELRQLTAVETQATELSQSIPAATSSTLGELALRGGSRNLPMALFGGPVLCVASRPEDNINEEGSAHFFSRKKGETDIRACAYSSTGPTLPYPELCTWDDDGRLCAVAIDGRVAIYVSDEPDFVLLGTVRIGSPSLPVATVTSLRFIHGVLYCGTWNSVHCVILGDLSGGDCRLDSYLLASTDIPALPIDHGSISDENFAGPLMPSPIALPLIQPIVLGYQSGSLILSTLRGVFAVALHNPLLRIGILLSSGQVERATKWLDAVNDTEHENLAYFLERRGYPDLALQHLPGLSLETIVDISMRHGNVNRLEEIVEAYGARGLRAIDMGRGVSTGILGLERNANSLTVCVGAYLLAQGRLEVVRRLASECLRLDEQGKRDAFFLGSLLLPLDESDASRLIQRAVEHTGALHDWALGKFVHDHIRK